MHVVVQSKTLDITDSLRDFVNRQAEKLEKLGIHILHTHVYLETNSRKSNDPQSSSVKYHVSIPGMNDVVVRRKGVDMYDAIVDATRRVVRQIRKSKEKRIDRHRKSSS